MAKYLDMPGLTYFYNQIKNKFAFKSDIGAPLKASTAAGMTNTNKIYIYTGSETGYTAGHWYYYDSGSWHDGGTYNSSAVETDKTLSVSDMPADAKVTGDEVTDLKSATNELDSLFISLNVYDADSCLNNTGLKTKSGATLYNESYWITDYLKIPNNTYITSNYGMYKAAFYDANKEFIIAQTTEDSNSYSIPENSAFVRVQYDKSVIAYGSENVIIAFSNDQTIPIFSQKKEVDNTNLLIKVDADNLDSDLKHYIASLGELTEVEWELGTIAATTGIDRPGDNRVRSVGYIPIDLFYVYTNDLFMPTILFCYDEQLNFLGRMVDDFSLNYYKKSEVLSKYPTTKNIRLLFKTSSSVTDVENNTKVFGSEALYKAFTAYDEVDTIISPSGYYYEGNRIEINRNRCRYVQLAVNGNGQDAAVYEHWLFTCDKSGRVFAKSIDDGLQEASMNMGFSPHCNSVVFGNKYAESDDFPLLYVNAYNSSGFPNGQCFVLRFTASDGVPTGVNLVQTITVAFADTEPWTDGNDIRPYGNFFVDKENGFLWAYTLKDNLNVTRFFKFALPNVSSTTITLSTSDILEQFDIPYLAYIQGNTFNDGKAYILSGFGTEAYHGYLNVVDLTKRSLVSRVDINSVGITQEPEYVDVFENSLIVGTTHSYKFDF